MPNRKSQSTATAAPPSIHSKQGRAKEKMAHYARMGRFVVQKRKNKK